MNFLPASVSCNCDTSNAMAGHRKHTRQKCIRVWHERLQLLVIEIDVSSEWRGSSTLKNKSYNWGLLTHCPHCHLYKNSLKLIFPCFQGIIQYSKHLHNGYVWERKIAPRQDGVCKKTLQKLYVDISFGSDHERLQWWLNGLVKTNNGIPKEVSSAVTPCQKMTNIVWANSKCVDVNLRLYIHHGCCHGGCATFLFIHSGFCRKLPSPLHC